jgi:small subunit ribosomal protein S16
MRMGKTKAPMYRIVVVDGRSQRDSRYIDQIGRYEPLHNPSIIEIDNEKAAEWLAKGAQPSERVEKLLNISGAMNTMKMRTGTIHVVAPKTAPAAAETTEPEADVSEPEAEAAAESAEAESAPAASSEEE